MGHFVPLFPCGDVVDAEVGRQVNHAYTFFHKGRCFFHGHAIGRGKEHEVATVKPGIFRRLECNVVNAAKAGEVVRYCNTGFASAGDGSNLCVGVAAEQTQQFNACVTGCTDDTNFNFCGHGVAPL